ncbi:MAG: putative DNA binding domain-containing protein [Clostridia bacterium]|nr:putative DNA binding domain-containing protein [Clostridia bacterium]
MKIETEHMEFKSRVTDELYKEVIAFANTEGGEILVGVDDHGQPIGMADIDEEYTRITNGIRDAIAPDVTMFVRYAVKDHTISITIAEGANKPYYLKGKGLKPSGVYVRQGASSVPASPEMIRRMIRDSDGDIFEEMRSLNQNLTFETATQCFMHAGVEFKPEKYRTLGIIRADDGLYTNLALLLSDQCAHTVKIAVFTDKSNTIFRDHREFSGSVFTQLEEAYQYLNLCNRTPAVIHGLMREGHSDYPEAAVREALLNAVIHRDYSYSGSIIINVNDQEMSFVSLGGLVPGLTPEDIRSGISQPRNQLMAAIFYRLRMIEAYGTGIRRIYDLYEDCQNQPRIDVTANTFRITLPNRNSLQAKHPQKTQEETLSPQMYTVQNHIRTNGPMTFDQIQSLLGVKKTRAYAITKQMQDMGAIVSSGRGSSRIYSLQ